MLRDDHDLTVVDVTSLLHHVLDATAAEVLSKKLDCLSVPVKFDSMKLVQACNETIQIRGVYTMNLVECFLIAPIISSISFQHCLREATRIAHNLARHTC